MCQIIKFKHEMVYQNKQHTTTIYYNSGSEICDFSMVFLEVATLSHHQLWKSPDQNGDHSRPFHGFTAWKANLSVPSPGAAPFWMCQHFSKSGWQPHFPSVLQTVLSNFGDDIHHPICSIRSRFSLGILNKIETWLRLPGYPGYPGLTRFKAFPTRSMVNDPFKNAQNDAHSNTRATQEFDTKLIVLTCKKHVFYILKKKNIKRESPRLRVVHQHHEELGGGGFGQIAVPQGLILRWRERLL